MNLRYHPASEEADASDHVLLEHWATFSGRQLVLRVTTADADSPDTVTVHVRYGSGQAGIVISARGGGSERQDVNDIDGVMNAVMAGEHNTEPVAVDIVAEDLNSTERNEETACASNRSQERQDPLLRAVNITGQDVHTTLKTTRCSQPEQEQSALVGKRETSAIGQGERAETAVIEPCEVRNCQAAEMMAPVSAVKSLGECLNSVSKQPGIGAGLQASLVPLPKSAQVVTPSDEIVSSDQEACVSEENHSVFSTDSGVATSAEGSASITSQFRVNGPDIRKAEQTELRIKRFDVPTVLDDEALEKLLRDMPALKVLTVEWRLDRRKLDIDIVRENCRNLVEIDLTRFRLDTRSLQQLCVACPGLEVVKLPRKCDDSHVEVLLRNLPNLRSLDLAHTKVTGHFLDTSHESLEKLSLSGCNNLQFDQLDQVYRSAEKLPQAGCWKTVRSLNLSSTEVTTTDLTKVLSHFPAIGRLYLGSCGKLESGSLLQVALSESLSELDVTDIGYLRSSDLLAILIRCPMLESLTMAGCTITESSHLRQIDLSQAVLRLGGLNVSRVKGLATVDLNAILARSPQLKYLSAPEVDEIDLTACLNQLRSCTKLKMLSVSQLDSLKRVPPAQSEAGAAITSHSRSKEDYESGVGKLLTRQIQPDVLTALLLSCQKLEQLTLGCCHFTESASLRQLVHCPRLRHLDLGSVTTVNTEDDALSWRKCRSVEAADLAQGLSGCPELESLTVDGMKAPLEELLPPTGLPKLEHLSAGDSGLTNNSLRCLRSLCPGLRTLSIHYCESTSQDGLMSYLPRLKLLRTLHIHGTSGVTDAVLEKLKKCNLRRITLDGPKINPGITVEGLKRLALDCPSLKILDLDASGDSVRAIGDTIRQEMPLDRFMVLCFTDDNTERDLPEQHGPLLVLPDDKISSEEE